MGLFSDIIGTVIAGVSRSFLHITTVIDNRLLRADGTSGAQDSGISVNDDGEMDMNSKNIMSLLDPTSNQDAATKIYVDNSVGFTFDYFLSDTLDAIGGIYYVMTNSDLGGVESDLDTVIGSTGDNKPLVNFITPSGEPGITMLENGIYEVHIHAEKISGGSSVDGIYWELYKRETDTTETLLGTSEVSGAVSSAAEYNIHLSLSSPVTIDTTDRLLIKFYANLSGGAGATVRLTQEGNTAAHFEFQTTSTILSNIFVRLFGKPGGQTVIGGTGVGEDLTFQSNSTGTPGNIIIPDGEILTFGTGLDGLIYSDSDDLYIVNATSDKDIIFKVNDGGANTVLMTLDGSTSRVGIGTATPAAKFHVALDAGALPSISAITAAVFSNSSDSGDDVRISIISGTNSGTSGINFGDAVNEIAGSITYRNKTTATDEEMFFMVNADRKLTILENGNLGVKVPDPDVDLEVMGALGAKISFDSVDYTGLSTNTNGYFHIDPSGGRVGINTANPIGNFHVSSTTYPTIFTIGSVSTTLVSGNILGELNFDTRLAGHPGTWAAITVDAVCTGTCSAGDVGAAMRFLTMDRSSETLTERMILNARGNVGIGLTPTGNMKGISVEAGLLTLKETTTPTADSGYGKIYTKDDNKFYVQTGDGVEHEIAFV